MFARPAWQSKISINSVNAGSIEGRVVPDSFTHGSAADRQRWLNTGYSSGDPKACDTFGSGR